MSTAPQPGGWRQRPDGVWEAVGATLDDAGLAPPPGGVSPARRGDGLVPRELFAVEPDLRPEADGVVAALRRLQSIGIVCALALGGAFFFVFLARLIWVPDATVAGSFWAAAAAAVLTACGLMLEARATTLGSWVLTVVAAAAGVSLVSSLVAVAVGEPFAPGLTAMFAGVCVVGCIGRRCQSAVEQAGDRLLGRLTGPWPAIGNSRRPNAEARMRELLRDIKRDS